MKAALFFRVINHGRKIYSRERNLFLADLCDVGVISHSFQNYKTSKDSFRERVFEKKTKAFPADDIRSFQMAEAMFRATNPAMARRH